MPWHAGHSVSVALGFTLAFRQALPCANFSWAYLLFGNQRFEVCAP